MAWATDYNGTIYSRESFKRHLDSIPTSQLSWIKHLTVHNTGSPTMSQQRATRGGASQRMKNAKPHYAKWGKGPAYWVFETGEIGKGTPLPAKGVHSPSWNATSMGVEMVADFRKGSDDPTSAGGRAIVDTTAWLFAQVLAKLGLPANAQTIRLHKEDARTTHDCPGNLFSKADFIIRVQNYMGMSAPVPEPEAVVTPTPAPTAWVSGVPVGDWLNTRSGPGTTYVANGKLYNGTKLTVLETKPNWARVRTPNGHEVWVSSRYLAPTAPQAAVQTVSPVPAPTPAPVPASAPPAPTPGLQAPGSYRMDGYGVDWARRFEGLELKAYLDAGTWAICYGHNANSGIPPLPKQGDTATREECDAILAKDIALQERYLNAYAQVPLSQDEVNAWALHIFQQGPGNFRNSKELALLNAGKRADACHALYTRVHKSAGVTRRFQTLGRMCKGERPTKW